MLDLNELITHWGYAGIFVVVILGNIGLPVPEETVLAVAGYLVWSGRLHLLPVLLVGLASAVVGDNVGYWLGRRAFFLAREPGRGGALRAVRGRDRLCDRLWSGAIHGPSPAGIGRLRPRGVALGDHRGHRPGRVAHDH
jgi:hypothetical protein